MKPPDDLLPLFFFFPLDFFFEQHQQKAAAGTPCCAAFGGAESQSMCAHKGGKSIQKANCSLRPWAIRKWETAQREIGEGVDNMFPLLLNTERNNNADMQQI